MIGATGIRQTSALLSMCTEYLVDLHNMVPFSPRLRQLFVRSVELIGYKRFAEGGAERFVELLNISTLASRIWSVLPTGCRYYWTPSSLLKEPEAYLSVLGVTGGTNKLNPLGVGRFRVQSTGHGIPFGSPGMGEAGSVGWVLSGYYGHPRLIRRQGPSRTRCYCCSASGLVLCKNSHDG
jgi:hypothetical protein